MLNRTVCIVPLSIYSFHYSTWPYWRRKFCFQLSFTIGLRRLFNTHCSWYLNQVSINWFHCSVRVSHTEWPYFPSHIRECIFYKKKKIIEHDSFYKCPSTGPHENFQKQFFSALIQEKWIKSCEGSWKMQWHKKSPHLLFIRLK